MNADSAREDEIIHSWRKNAPAWADAVQSGEIESRRLVTDAAVIEAVLSRSPRSVLDVGCGEGWLTRELAARNIHVTGIDVVPELVDDARRRGGGEFQVCSYQELAAGKLNVGVDVMVCNFSLLGKASTEAVLAAATRLLNRAGAVIVQTLHPRAACGGLPYRDGWREGSWTGFNCRFTDPAPWYFRTLESWASLFVEHGLRVLEVREPVHPDLQTPVSAIFIGVAAE